MILEEFYNTRFGGNMFCTYQGQKKFIMSVSFEEALFGLTDEKADIHPEEWIWVRCENIELIKDN